mmetsp:Transcript_47249/g.137511  ORF Transcript_47249/g.137511 Transcript_47249/m.137511 type:complete len:210 (+) Transcript_47249:1-630(+)
MYWSGSVGDDTGALYLGEAARTNEHYTGGTVVGPARLGELGFYDIDVLKLEISSQSRVWGDTSFQCSAGSSDKACIVDTGTPSIVVPKEIADFINELAESGQPLGSLSFTLAGAAGAAAVKLEFDLRTLLANRLISAGAGNGIILGLPLWAWYYTVFDIKAGAVEFIPVDPPMAATTTPALFGDGGWDFGGWRRLGASPPSPAGGTLLV